MNQLSLFEQNQGYPMTSVDSLSGVEFEHLCQKLLQKCGFHVETTKQSRDGGIDLIATNSNTFLSGKYLVQCKRYTGVVGEPIVRDLFGVVMAERANKGILITTGRFSESALQFADNKNIELIDGDKLFKLLDNLSLSQECSSSTKRHFSEYPEFDAQKYQIYKDLVFQVDCTEEIRKKYLFEFLMQYFVAYSSGISKELCNLLHASFAAEYLHDYDKLIGKITKKTKYGVALRDTFDLRYRGIAELFNGDFYDYVYKRQKLIFKKDTVFLDLSEDGFRTCKRFSLQKLNTELPLDVISHLGDSNYIRYSAGYYFYEKMNLLAIFSFLGIAEGVEMVYSSLSTNCPQIVDWVQSLEDCKNAENRLVIYTFDHYPVLYNFKNGGKLGAPKANDACKRQWCFELNDYFTQFSDQFHDKLQSEKKRIKGLLTALD